MLSDLDLQHDYRSGRDALLDDFYIPCLEEAQTYDRAVGFFSSSLLHVVAVAYSDFVVRGGHMRLVCSPALSQSDFEAMKTGVERSERAQDLARQELERLLTIPEAVPATKLLATLICAGVLEVQLAFLDHSPGIFHDKLGVFEDVDGRRVSFVGSANETWAAWGLNHESFEVFCSWRGEAELLRTRRHAEDFQRLWRGHEPGVCVEGLSSVTRERLVGIAEDDLDTAMAQALVGRRRSSDVPRRELFPHQRAVLESWRNHDHRGIVAFATGAGKTLTAIEAIREWTRGGRPALILVPTRELHRQWISELSRELPAATPLHCGAGAGVSAWADLLSAYTGTASLGSGPRIVVATNATFASPVFKARLDDGEHLLVVVDEMHRLGSRAKLEALLETHSGGRLGLSATYRRQFDELGTAQLVGWFGEVLEPVVGLAEAILMGLLVPYDYALSTLTLDHDEMEKYDLLTKKIGRAAGSIGTRDADDYLRMLLIERARLLKQARGKVAAAIVMLEREYSDGDRWLVYCDDTGQLNELIGAGLEKGLPVMEYHSAMSGDRAAVLQSLERHGGIVVAIRCLDEGVDIPVCDNALILASSTVDREYIQRRGRVLRSAPNKVHARIFDLLLVNEWGGVLARSEALRALEFARLSRNPAARAHLHLLLARSPDIEALPGLEEDDLESEEDD